MDIEQHWNEHNEHADSPPEWNPVAYPGMRRQVRKMVALPNEGDRVSLLISDRPDPVVGVVTLIERDAIGEEVARIRLADGSETIQATKFLTLATPYPEHISTMLLRETAEEEA